MQLYFCNAKSLLNMTLLRLPILAAINSRLTTITTVSENINASFNVVTED